MSIDADATFAALLDWTQAALTGSEPGAEEVASNIRPSKTLTASERLRIYRDMIVLRLEGVVAADYPATRALLGERSFAARVSAYVATRPSTNFTLDGYAREFPECLASAGEEAAAALARYEAAIDATFDALEEAEADPQRLAAVPPDDWPSKRLAPAGGFRLFDSTHDVERAYAAWLDDRPTKLPPKRPTTYALFRVRGRVGRLRLSPKARVFVAALAADATLLDATTEARRAGLRSDAMRRLSEKLFQVGAFRDAR